MTTVTRRLVAAIIAIILVAGANTPPAHAADGWAAVTDGAIVLFRHAEAPGVGDPAGFRVGDCATQRNLSEAGRTQARRIGEAFRARGVTVGKVLTSQWCRCRDTAELAFPGQVTDAVPFNSFFADRSQELRQTAEARAMLTAWTGPGVLVVVTHQVNITALTGMVSASGEGTVVRIVNGTLTVAGHIVP